MRRRYLWPSLACGAWATLVTFVGRWLDWSDDTVFAVAMLMVPVMVLVVGLTGEAGKRHGHSRPGHGR
jgi:hypothetical protein